MNPKAIAGVMIVASVAVMLVAARQPDPAQASAVVAARAQERPWLSEAAADQLVGPEGAMGPVFAGIDLGGPPPTPEQLSRVEALAKANGVTIQFEVVANELVAVRFGVTFGGCCGYEGADTFARRFARPWAQEYCTAPHEWLDDWSFTTETGTHIRGRVRVNRVEVRWELGQSFDEMLTEAEQLLGKDRAEVRDAAGDRWIELQPNRLYLLEAPFRFDYGDWVPTITKLEDRADLGFHVVTEHGVIREVSFELRDFDRVGDVDISEAMEARWGTVHALVQKEGEGAIETWRTRGRTYVLERPGFTSRITLSL